MTAAVLILLVSPGLIARLGGASGLTAHQLALAGNAACCGYALALVPGSPWHFLPAAFFAVIAAAEAALYQQATARYHLIRRIDAA
jgi:hypothetical protein